MTFEEHIDKIVNAYIEKSGGDYKKLALMYDDVEKKQEELNGKYETVFEALKDELAYLITKLVIYQEKNKGQNNDQWDE